MIKLASNSSIVSLISDENAGIMIEVHADPRTRRVHWMSDWSLCDKLDGLGLLTHIHYGPATYGHVSFFLPVSRDTHTAHGDNPSPTGTVTARGA